MLLCPEGELLGSRWRLRGSKSWTAIQFGIGTRVPGRIHTSPALKPEPGNLNRNDAFFYRDAARLRVTPSYQIGKPNLHESQH